MHTRSRLRAAAVALVGVLTAALFTFAAPVAATAAGTASISGTVTVPAGVTVGEYDLFVSVSGVGNDDYGYADVATDGTYSVTGLGSGEYKIQFGSSSSLGLVSQWWKNKPDYASATLLKLAAGEAKTGIDAKLVKGGTITGKITLPSGTKAKFSDIGVSVVSAKDRYSYLAWGSIDQSGKYTVTGVPSGSVKVVFVSYNDDLLEQWWNNKPTFEKATKVSVAAGKTTSGINAKLVRAAKITGKVTLPSGVKRTKDSSVYVSLYSASKETYVAGASVASSGKYTITGVPAGSYKLSVSTYRVNTLPQWWKGKTTWAKATKFAVKAGQTKSKVDVKLVKGATISGKVTVPKGSGTKLANIGVEVYRSDKRDYVGWATVSSKGTYSVDQLPAGTYKVRFTPSDGTAAAQWSSGKADWAVASKIKVSTSQAKKNVNASLKVGGSISGKVTGSAGVKKGTAVQAYRLAGDGEWEYGGWGYTSASGSYKIPGLSTGKYAVQFLRVGSAIGTSLPSSTAPTTQLTPVEVAPPTAAKATVWEKWYKDKPDAESANRVSVTAKKTTTGINTNLDVKPKTQKLTTVTPKVSGTAKVGKKLTAKPGKWTKYTTFTYQWYANGKAISKATKSSFTLTKSQKGKKITVKVTGKKTGYKTASKTSKATAKVT